MADLYPGNFCVELEQVLAACSNLHVARAAYAEAVRRFPDKLIYLRQRAFVVERHEPEQGD